MPSLKTDLELRQEAIAREEEYRKKWPDMYKPYLWGDKYVAQYPHLFRGTHHIGVMVGWEPIIRTLLAVLDHHVNNLPEEVRGTIYIAQIKEKFGGLRFYMSHETPFMRGAIEFAEALSESTCEDCGKPGRKQNPAGWIKCRCDACHAIAVEEAKQGLIKYNKEMKKKKAKQGKK